MQPLVIDGGYGESGGQIVRTALSLSAITGRPIRIDNIRARRPNPGLAAQHLTTIRALAALCNAEVSGDVLDSLSLEFTPRRSAKSGDYEVDIGAAREGGSAGAATLVAQTVLLPLALIDGVSHVTIHGGTHMAWSPPFDYVRDVWLPALTNIGIQAQLELVRWGWFPVGDGELRTTIEGHDRGRRPLRRIEILDRGPLHRIGGRAVASRLPAHITDRMVGRVQALLQDLHVSVEIKPLHAEAACPGAGIFLIAEYENTHCGFSGLGAAGRPAEAVAEEAVVALLGHYRSGEAFDEHLADQVLLPLALAASPSRFTAERSSAHLVTNASVIEQFGLAEVTIEPSKRGVPAHSTFDFQDVSSFEATAREALLAFLPSLANKSFHIRVHRRGFKHRISGHDEERRLGASLLESLASGGTPGRLAFEDPDALVAIETVGQRAGVSVWTREELRRYPFIRVD